MLVCRRELCIPQMHHSLGKINTSFFFHKDILVSAGSATIDAFDGDVADKYQVSNHNLKPSLNS